MPLASLKILDFTRVLSGPYCTSLLAQIGADIIKIEPPNGDDYRHIGPFIEGHKSALFETVNRGKRSLVLDLGRQEDRAVAIKLGAQADVVVEILGRGWRINWGLGLRL